MVKIGHAIPGKDKREPKAPETKEEEQPKPKEEKAEDNQQPSASDAEQSVKKIDHIDLGGGVLESTPEHEGQIFFCRVECNLSHILRWTDTKSACAVCGLKCKVCY